VKVPVVGLCESVCASGGMYALMSPSVKFIAVGEESVAGSIGVIGHLTRYSRLLDWAKIDVETYKSGEYKDDGNPSRAATSAERARIQAFVDELAQKFYGVVLKARPKVDLAAIKPAGVFIGEKAVSVGLADAVMPREKVLEKAKELSGSKLIFTREEIGKMTKDAHGDSSAYQAPVIAPRAETVTWMADLHEIVEAMKEIKAGETVRFEYRMNYQF
jgi:ClpP class serine protease